MSGQDHQAGGASPAATEALVFIHGAQQDGSCWQSVAPAFARPGRQVLTPDLPGHGASADPPLPDIAAMADWIAGQLAAAGIGLAALVGHSMGSLVAIDLALRHPARVSRLALVGSALPMAVAPALLDTARQDEAAAMATINAWSLTQGAQESAAATSNRQVMARQKAGVLAVDLHACNTYLRPPATLAGIAAPVLIVAGGQDRMTSPRAARALAQAMPQARRAQIIGCGHAMMAEAPGALVAALRPFLR